MLIEHDLASQSGSVLRSRLRFFLVWNPLGILFGICSMPALPGTNIHGYIAGPTTVIVIAS